MAKIGKALGWITRTLLGTQTPASFDHRGHSDNSIATKIHDKLGLFRNFYIISCAVNVNSKSKCQLFLIFLLLFFLLLESQSDFNKMNSDSDEPSGEFSRFSMQINDLTQNSSRSEKSSRDTTLDTSAVFTVRRRAKKPIINSDTESSADESKHSESDSSSSNRRKSIKKRNQIIDSDSSTEDSDKNSDRDELNESKSSINDSIVNKQQRQVRCHFLLHNLWLQIN